MPARTERGRDRGEYLRVCSVLCVCACVVPRARGACTHIKLPRMIDETLVACAPPSLHKKSELHTHSVRTRCGGRRPAPDEAPSRTQSWEEYGGSVDDLLDRRFGHCQLCATLHCRWRRWAGDEHGVSERREQREWGDATLVRAAPTLFRGGCADSWSGEICFQPWMARDHTPRGHTERIFKLCGAIARTPRFGISRAACGFAEGAAPLPRSRTPVSFTSTHATARGSEPLQRLPVGPPAHAVLLVRRVLEVAERRRFMHRVADRICRDQLLARVATLALRGGIARSSRAARRSPC